VLHPDTCGDGAVSVETSVPGERVGGDIHDPHDQRTFAEDERLAIWERDAIDASWKGAHVA